METRTGSQRRWPTPKLLIKLLSAPPKLRPASRICPVNARCRSRRYFKPTRSRKSRPTGGPAHPPMGSVHGGLLRASRTHRRTKALISPANDPAETAPARIRCNALSRFSGEWDWRPNTPIRRKLMLRALPLVLGLLVGIRTSRIRRTELLDHLPGSNLLPHTRPYRAVDGPHWPHSLMQFERSKEQCSHV
jgi:hypothetical protein